MMASYQLRERVNTQVILWAVGSVVYWSAVAVAQLVRWLWAILSVVGMVALLAAFVGVVAVGKVLYANRAAILYAGRVLAITAGWVALLVGAVVLAALYWHIVLALGGWALALWAICQKGK